jgi:2-keto-4-pentenoate hydratase/2-oxohepta-3-ene-1,7-dioic acid hydratase in catechol pathway
MPRGFASIHTPVGVVPYVVVEDRAAPLAALAGAAAPPSMRALLDDWDRWDSWLRAARLDPANDEWRVVSSLRFAPVVPDPPSIYCAGANYADHVAGMTAGQRFEPTVPYHFMVSPQALLGHGGTIKRPAACRKLDWEVELAVVVGHRAAGVAIEDALACVAGYCVANDVSLRDLLRRTDAQPFPIDWLRGKSYATCLPLGPLLVPRHDVPDPQALGLSLRVNGEVRQDSRTDQMVFTVAEQLAHLSRLVPLVPGDVVLTGTPAGTGHESGTYLEPGDVVTASVEGLGVLENAVADADGDPPHAAGTATTRTT